MKTPEEWIAVVDEQFPDRWSRAKYFAGESLSNFIQAIQQDAMAEQKRRDSELCLTTTLENGDAFAIIILEAK